MRRLLVPAAVLAIATAAVPAAAAASTEAGPAPVEARALQAGVSFTPPWKHSITKCVGRKRARTAIKWLKRGRVSYALVAIGIRRAKLPGKLDDLFGLGARVNSTLTGRWARDTASAYLHSGRRGAKIRVGFLQGAFGLNPPWWDAMKRDGSCS